MKSLWASVDVVIHMITSWSVVTAVSKLIDSSFTLTVKNALDMSIVQKYLVLLGILHNDPIS